MDTGGMTCGHRGCDTGMQKDARCVTWGCRGHDAGTWKDRGMMQKHCGWDMMHA